MLASDWSKNNIGLFFSIFWLKTIIGYISATVQDRSMCKTPNRSNFQGV